MTLVQKIAVWALPVIFAITVHEAAHGYAARALGDRTAQMMGRLSLNPLRHIDLVGTVVVPLVLLILGGFLFGWAKPVPVDYRNLKHPRRDMALVAAAGPASNALMAIAWGILLRVSLEQGADEGLWMGLRYMAVSGILINLVLMVLNLIPLPPLDGGRVLTGLLPARLAYRFSRIEPYGMVILVVLMATGLLGKLMFWPLSIAEYSLFSALGIASGGMLLSGS
ncbi:Zn-dependent protease (includes SpoIVFB) [Solimonas aquatica]|uniref:Zn-dependent protease (Includes SpoIVFB) n=2 Tax=Solimonas aquatica TaxID=489703 RepID=A0A1H9I1T7_9GAMM|nr:Zn-dependent protease (includes SpoIVFB) [Solimonas aquatica]